MRILMVDDEAAFRDVLIKRFQKRGMNAFGVGCGREAVRKMATQKYHVVLLDVCMPGMDGIAVLKQIRAAQPNCEVIMLTGHACLQSAAEGMALGAFDYLMKPVDMEALIFKIEDAFEKVQLNLNKQHKENRVT